MVDRPGGATSTPRADTTPANGDAGGPPRSDGGFGNTLDQAQGAPQENNALDLNSLSPEFQKMFMEALAQLLSGAGGGGGGGPAGGGGNSGSGSGDGISLEDIMKLLSMFAQADQQASNQAQGQGAGTDTGSGQQPQPTAA